MCRWRLIQTLKKSGAECASVNKRPTETHTLQTHAVKHTAPLTLTFAIESLGMLELEQRFGLPVTGLLL
jgi:hypothetical protein